MIRLYIEIEIVELIDGNCDKDRRRGRRSMVLKSGLV